MEKLARLIDSALEEHKEKQKHIDVRAAVGITPISSLIWTNILQTLYGHTEKLSETKADKENVRMEIDVVSNFDFIIPTNGIVCAPEALVSASFYSTLITFREGMLLELWAGIWVPALQTQVLCWLERFEPSSCDFVEILN